MRWALNVFMIVLFGMGTPCVVFAMSKGCFQQKGGCQQGKTLRIALLIGHNKAGHRAPKLDFAETDAKKVRSLLLQLGGYKASHVWLLQGQPASVVLRTIDSIRIYVKRQKRKKPTLRRVMLFVYYSGHASRGRLLLGKTTLRFQLLKSAIATVSSSLRLVIIDACESGRITQSKGFKRRKDKFAFPFVRLNPSATGEVIISATGEREKAHEDQSLKGGVFTHFFISGLRGAADRDNNGYVTLEEAYSYAYNRSLERTILSSKGPQRARFSKKLSGYGTFVLSTLSRQTSWLKLDRHLGGEFFVWNRERNTLLADVVKVKGKWLTVALPPGGYILQWRRGKGVYHKEIKLREGKPFRLKKKGKRLAFSYGGKSRGQDTAEIWTSFQGQLIGSGLSFSYMSGFSAIDQSLISHGASLQILLPIEKNGNTGSILLQSNVLFGSEQKTSTFGYQPSFLDLDIGYLWTVLERSHWWIGVGPLLRTTMIFQQITKHKNSSGELFLSFAGGLGGLLSVQYGFLARWFLQSNLFLGSRLLSLGGKWTIRWDSNLTLGAGLRF